MRVVAVVYYDAGAAHVEDVEAAGSGLLVGLEGAQAQADGVDGHARTPGGSSGCEGVLYLERDEGAVGRRDIGCFEQEGFLRPFGEDKLAVTQESSNTARSE